MDAEKLDFFAVDPRALPRRWATRGPVRRPLAVRQPTVAEMEREFEALRESLSRYRVIGEVLWLGDLPAGAADVTIARAMIKRLIWLLQALADARGS